MLFICSSKTKRARRTNIAHVPSVAGYSSGLIAIPSCASNSSPYALAYFFSYLLRSKSDCALVANALEGAVAMLWCFWSWAYSLASWADTTNHTQHTTVSSSSSSPTFVLGAEKRTSILPDLFGVQGSLCFLICSPDLVVELLPSAAVCAAPAVAFLPSVVSISSVVVEGVAVPVVAVLSSRAAMALHLVPHQAANPVCLVLGCDLAVCGELPFLRCGSSVAAVARHSQIACYAKESETV